MTKEKLKEQIEKIFTMTAVEIEDYRRIVSVSFAKSREKAWLYKACDSRFESISRKHAMVENCDMSDFN